jgi:hypothetical protein
MLGGRSTSSSETLRRYGAPSEALEAHWQERLAASAEPAAERDEALATYMGWMRGESR